MQIQICRVFSLLSMLASLQSFGRSPAADTTITVYFQHNRYQLSIGEKQKLDSLLVFYQYPVVKSVNGYTDKNGSGDYNHKLAARRSRHVMAHLKSLPDFQGQPSVGDFGEENPASVTDLALNRRVEILVATESRTAAIAPADTAEIAGPAKVVENDPTILKRISFENIYFVPDMAMVEYNSLSYLDQLASVLRAYTNEIFEIRGHVNCPGFLEGDSLYMIKMDKLSENRAKEVYNQLIARGIAAKRLSYLGMSNREMVYPNAKTMEEQRKNMRVEVIVRR